MAISKVQSSRATVASKGYRLTTTRSIGLISCSAIIASSIPRRPNKPPWILGCSVLIRPAIISGKPVCSETSLTVRPASFSSLAVPPVDSNSTPNFVSCLASSSTPVLSETLNSARWILFIEKTLM